MKSRRDRDKKGTARRSPDLALEQKLWAALRASENQSERAALLADLTTRFVSGLADAPAQSSFRRLCEVGSNDTALAYLLFAMQQQPAKLESLLNSCLGSPRQRQSRARSWIKTAEELERFWVRTVLTIVVQAIPKEAKQGRTKIEVEEQSVRAMSESLAADLSTNGLLPPMLLANQLRLFASVNSTLSRLKGNALSDALKYSLTAYVKHSTGGFHDPEVAALIAASMPASAGYSVRAHIMWRTRHYERLSKSWAIVPTLLVASHQSPS